MAGAEPRGLGLRVDGDELVSERTGRRLARLADAEGAEAAVFTDPEQGTVYKVFRRGNGGSLGNRLVIDADGNALLDTGTEADVAEKVRVINALGGVPTEIVGRTEDGELVVKQPHGRRDVVDKDSARAVNAAARLVEIPDAVLPRPHGFGGLYYANIGGQDVVVDDLHPGNYVGDTLGRGRILDLATHRLTPEELARLPKLREWIEAQREHATATGPVQFAKRGEEPNAPVTPEDEAAAMADAEKAFEDLSPEAQARLRRVADKQQAEVERANAEVLRAHDQEGKPLPAPNGQPSKLTRGQWVRVRTPLFKRWFGDWDAVARATMPRAANTLAEAKTAAAAFVGQPIRNQRTGLSATVSNTNLGKMTSESAGRKSASMADHALAVANADRLFAEAVLDRTHADRDQEPTIRAIHRYVAPMLTPNGEVRAVKLTVKETTSPKNPNPLYSIEALEIENPPSVLARVSPDETGTHPQAGLSESTLQVLRSVNPAAVSKVVDANGEPLVVWHGTENDGFSVFRTEIGSGKTHGTGAFFPAGKEGLRRIPARIERPRYLIIVPQMRMVTSAEAHPAITRYS